MKQGEKNMPGFFISNGLKPKIFKDVNWIVNIKSDRFYKVRALLNSTGDKYPSVPCKRMLLNQ